MKTIITILENLEYTDKRVIDIHISVQVSISLNKNKNFLKMK